MFRKQIVFIIAVVCVLLSGVTAFADSVCTREEFGKMLITLSDKLDTSDKITELPEEYKNCNKVLKEAASRCIMPLEYVEDSEAQVVKQDAARLVYNILVSADAQFSLSEEQAEEILNACYDNAYLREENKIPYASMIRHGVIGIRGQSNPDEVFTDAAAEAFIGRVNALFQKTNPITVGGKTISIGSSVNEVFTKLGDPDRIDVAADGVSWHIFNGSYLDFIAVGIKDDVVCGYFSNAASLDLDSLPKKSSQVSYIYGKDGAPDAVYCNAPGPGSEVHRGMIFDIINAYRAKNGQITFVSKAARTLPLLSHDRADRVVEMVVGETFTEVYEELLGMDSGDGILSHSFGMASEIYTNYSDGAWEITAVDAKNKVIGLINPLPSENGEGKEPVKKIRTPKLVSPADGEKTKGGKLTLTLESRAADKYLVKLFNCEKESYDVFAYISADSTALEIPGYILTDGNLYRACVTAVSGGKELCGNTVEFTHGNAATRIDVVSPVKNLSTYDDELEISLYSSAYRDFRIDVYDRNNKSVLTKELKGTNECVLEPLSPGVYYVCATAVSHADGTEKGNAFTTVEIKHFEPIINEFILEPGETFDYYYGDGEEWIYLYDTETVAVTEEKIQTVIVPDMAGAPDPAENVPVGDGKPSPSFTAEPEEAVPSQTPEPAQSPVPEATPAPVTQQISQPVTVYKTKVTQRILPATKRFKALAGMLPQYGGTTGEFISRKSSGTPTQTGNAIAAMALSYRGVPYLWGGTTPSGFDCSGLVKYICNSLGIKNVARTSREQFAHSGVSVSREELIPGDLIFFQKDGTVHHVGIYIGNNMFVHAPHTGDFVKISSLQDAYYQKEYAGAKRVF